MGTGTFLKAVEIEDWHGLNHIERHQQDRQAFDVFDCKEKNKDGQATDRKNKEPISLIETLICIIFLQKHGNVKYDIEKGQNAAKLVGHLIHEFLLEQSDPLLFGAWELGLIP